MKLDLDDLKGKVALVGAGPGDPELLTIRAHRLIRRADVVLCDNLASSQLLELCRCDARIIDVGKIPGGRATAQEVINALLVKEARNGHFVVRLKGGDPFVFGRGGEEAMHLRAHDIACEIVPGISSCIAVPERAGIPVTQRGVTTHFSVVTGVGATDPEALRETWIKLGRAGGTLVFLMAVRQMPRIVAALGEAGLDPETPAALIQEGTTQAQIVVQATLSTIVETARARGIEPPATFVVGDVVALRDSIACDGEGWTQLNQSVVG